MPRKPWKAIKVGLDLGENDKDPAAFRDSVVLAEKLGFDVAWLGDHFMPWYHSGDQSAFVWSLMGSSLEATKSIKVGPFVTTPIGGRYHPALIAQASATLDSLYPGRLAVGVGTGEAINEFPFLTEWPGWQERIDRLVEGMELIRKLWASTTHFDFDGRFFKERQIYLYTKPSTKLSILVSSTGPKSALVAGEHGDGLVTLASRNPPEKVRDVIFANFDTGARRAGKNPSKMEKIVSMSFTLDSPKDFLRQNRGPFGKFAREALDEPDPREIERMGPGIPDDALMKSRTFCSSWSEVAELVWKFKEMGTTQVVLPTGPDEEIRTYARKLLPQLHV